MLRHISFRIDLELLPCIMNMPHPHSHDKLKPMIAVMLRMLKKLGKKWVRKLGLIALGIHCHLASIYCMNTTNTVFLLCHYCMCCETIRPVLTNGQAPVARCLPGRVDRIAYLRGRRPPPLQSSAAFPAWLIV